jgi:hypothetical protein
MIRKEKTGTEWTPSAVFMEAARNNKLTLLYATGLIHAQGPAGSWPNSCHINSMKKPA